MSKLFFILFSFAAMLSAPAWANQTLATAKNCMACHSVEKKIVGPAFKDVAAKYLGDKTAPERIALKIQKGGAGVWGGVPMPANLQINDAEAKQLAAWILGLR